MGARRGEHDEFGGGLFAGNLPPLIAAAHELKSPLALIRQLSLVLESSELSAGEREQLLHQISLTSEQALRLTDGLTRSTRLEETLITAVLV